MISLQKKVIMKKAIFYVSVAEEVTHMLIRKRSSIDWELVYKIPSKSVQNI